MYVCIYVCAHMNVKIREGHWVSLSILLQHFLFQFVEILFVFMCMGLRQALSLNLELIDSASLSSQSPRQPRLSLLSQHWDYRCMATCLALCLLGFELGSWCLHGGHLRTWVTPVPVYGFIDALWACFSLVLQSPRHCLIFLWLSTALSFVCTFSFAFFHLCECFSIPKPSILETWYLHHQ